MYKHILIATDGSELAEKAVSAGLTLAKLHRAKATAMTASEPWAAAPSQQGSLTVPFDAYEEAAAAAAAKILARVRGLADQLDVECATVHIKDHPAEGILQAAKVRTDGAGCRGLCLEVKPRGF